MYIVEDGVFEEPPAGFLSGNQGTQIAPRESAYRMEALSPLITVGWCS